MKPVLAVVTLAFALSACSSNTGAPGAPGAQSAPSPARTSADVILREEIDNAKIDNAYDLVQRLRPKFLRANRSTGREQYYAVVFVDGVRRGTLETLRGIASASIAQLRYLTAGDATTRYGMDVSGGVIEVSTIQRTRN